MLASVPFQVKLNTESPFAPGDGGLGATDIRSDMPIAGGPWPPIGEFLDGEDCKPRAVEAEKMDLRFAHWSDGKYLPVEGPLKFGQSFYIEGKLKEPARKGAYISQITLPNGEEKEVPLFIRKEDDKLVRSKLLYFIWEPPAEISQ